MKAFEILKIMNNPAMDSIRQLQDNSAAETMVSGTHKNP